MSTIAVRPALPQDEIFLYELYAAVRGPEFAQAPITATQREHLIRMQFRASMSAYAQMFPNSCYHLVLLDGKPIRSCVTPIATANGHQVTTIEGLGTVDSPHPIQAAFITEQAMHCGFCISGPMLYGKAFIDQTPNATEADITKALNGLLCRCYAHTRMVRALVRYAKESA